jgi:hypothetical protein
VFDPFILMAEDWFKRGTFPDHPHRGFQTLTYVIDGRLEHIDNGGGRDLLVPGDVQYMNAGWAARHAEEGVEDDIAHTLQLWVNLPKAFKKTPTAYQNVYSEDAPLVEFEGGAIRVFSGEVNGVKGPLDPYVPMTMSEIHLIHGATYFLHIPENHNAFAYVLSGDLNFGEEEVNLKKHGVAILTFKEQGFTENPSELMIKSNARRSKVLVFSGVPIREPMVAYGPFVMSSMEEIQQAFQDFENGEFGPPAK